MSGGEHRGTPPGGCGITILVVVLIILGIAAIAVYVISASDLLK